MTMCCTTVPCGWMCCTTIVGAFCAGGSLCLPLHVTLTLTHKRLASCVSRVARRAQVCLGREVQREATVGGLLPHRWLEKAPLLVRMYHDAVVGCRRNGIVVFADGSRPRGGFKR